MPGDTWCALRAAERSRLIVQTPPSHFGHGISIVRLPPALLDPFRELRRSASEALLEEEVIPHTVTAIANEGTKAIARYVKPHFERGATDLDAEIAGGISVSAPGSADGDRAARDE